MYKPLLTLGLFASAVTAKSHTTELLFLGALDMPIIGSVITSDATATTYSLTCPVSQTDECGFPTSFSFTQGPSTMHFTMAWYDQSIDDVAIDVQCHLTGRGGDCTEAIIAQGTTSSRTTTSFTNIASQVGAQAVTITDGPLPAALGTTSTISSTSTTSTTSSTTRETASSNSSTSSSESSTVSSTTTKISTGGVPMITGHPQWVMGGAVAAAAFAAM